MNELKEKLSNKILVIADTEDTLDELDLSRYELVISCGDIAPITLEKIKKRINVPLLYIHGNHDYQYELFPPKDCIDIENLIYEYKGLKILGIGGSKRYKKGTNQYTEEEMKKRIFNLHINKEIDIVVAHSPLLGIGDSEDEAHTGFRCFNELVINTKPKYFLHGHIHLSDDNGPRIFKLNSTLIINCYHYFEI